jgi:hypothetical protein
LVCIYAGVIPVVTFIFEDPTGKIDSHRIYHITKIIKALQENAATDQDKLSQIEWAYLPLLDWHDIFLLE